MLDSHIVDSLEAFSNISQIPVTYFDPDGIIQWEANSERRICNFFDVYRMKNSTCTTVLSASADISSRLGEPYAFRCKAGFHNILFPLLMRGEMKGYFIAGPIAVESITPETITNILNINDLNHHPDTLSNLTVFLRTMKVYSSKELLYLSSLFGDAILSAITPNEDYTKLSSLNKKMASLAQREKGIQGKRKEEAESRLDLTKKTEKNSSGYKGRSNIINQAVQLIKTSYMHKISLEQVARKLYVNQSYLSMHFKHEMGITFTEYLNHIRIEEGLELLNSTNYSLMEISLNCGFDDQSYFTKVFKKSQGCTPKEYRQKHRQRLVKSE